MKSKEEPNALSGAVSKGFSKLADDEVELVAGGNANGGNTTVNLFVPLDGSKSAVELIMNLLAVKPQFEREKDKLLGIASQMDAEGKKRAVLEFDGSNCLVSFSIPW